MRRATDSDWWQIHTECFTDCCWWCVMHSKVCLSGGHCFTLICPSPVPPTTSIYPRDDVKVGSENTLICLVTGFYPPRLNVTWTKNGKIMTQGMSASQLRVNVNDFTFNQFHTLTFTPAERDIYTCTVEHSTLDLPITREFGKESLHNAISHQITWFNPIITLMLYWHKSSCRFDIAHLLLHIGKY